MWSETFDREITDIFSVQSEIAIEIAKTLQTRLTETEIRNISKEASTDITAYDYYLRWRQMEHDWSGDRAGLCFYPVRKSYQPRSLITGGIYPAQCHLSIPVRETGRSLCAARQCCKLRVVRFVVCCQGFSSQRYPPGRKVPGYGQYPQR